MSVIPVNVALVDMSGYYSRTVCKHTIHVYLWRVRRWDARGGYRTRSSRPALFPDHAVRDHARQGNRIAVRLPLLEPSGVGAAGIMPDGYGLVPRLHEHHVEDLASGTPVVVGERVDVFECLRGGALRRGVPSSESPPETADFSISASASSETPILLIRESSRSCSVLTFKNLDALTRSYTDQPVFPDIFRDMAERPIPIASAKLDCE